MKKLLILFCLLTFVLPIQASANNEMQSQLTDKISEISDWFWKLVYTYDAIVEKEKKKQFLRKVDKLRKELYVLEKASLSFINNLPDNPPTVIEQKNLTDGLNELESMLRSVINLLNDIGADIRQIDQETEDRTYKATRSRGVAIEELKIDLKEAVKNPQSWNKSDILLLFERAIYSLNKAQQRISVFQQNYE